MATQNFTIDARYAYNGSTWSSTSSTSAAITDTNAICYKVSLNTSYVSKVNSITATLSTNVSSGNYYVIISSEQPTASNWSSFKSDTSYSPTAWKTTVSAASSTVTIPASSALFTVNNYTYNHTFYITLYGLSATVYDPTVTLNYDITAYPNGAPTNVAVNQAYCSPSGNFAVSFTGASAGTNNSVIGYDIYYATSASGTKIKLGTLSSTATSGTLSTTVNFSGVSVSRGSTYYIFVANKSNVTGVEDTYSSAYATIVMNTLPPTPTISSSTVLMGSAATTATINGLSYSDTSALSRTIYYHIKASGASSTSSPSSSTTTSVTLTGLSASASSFTYEVYAYDGLEESANGVSVTIQRNEVPTFSSSKITGSKTASSGDGSLTAARTLTATYSISQTGKTISQARVYALSGSTSILLDTVSISSNSNSFTYDLNDSIASGFTRGTSYTYYFTVYDGYDWSGQSASSPSYLHPIVPKDFTDLNFTNVKNTDTDIQKSGDSLYYLGVNYRFKYSVAAFDATCVALSSAKLNLVTSKGTVNLTLSDITAGTGYIKEGTLSATQKGSLGDNQTISIQLTLQDVLGNTKVQTYSGSPSTYVSVPRPIMVSGMTLQTSPTTYHPLVPDSSITFVSFDVSTDSSHFDLSKVRITATSASVSGYSKVKNISVSDSEFTQGTNQIEITIGQSAAKNWLWDTSYDRDFDDIVYTVQGIDASGQLTSNSVSISSQGLVFLEAPVFTGGNITHTFLYKSTSGTVTPTNTTLSDYVVTGDKILVKSSSDAAFATDYDLLSGNGITYELFVSVDATQKSQSARDYISTGLTLSAVSTTSYFTYEVPILSSSQMYINFLIRATDATGLYSDKYYSKTLIGQNFGNVSIYFSQAIETEGSSNSTYKTTLSLSGQSSAYPYTDVLHRAITSSTQTSNYPSNCVITARHSTDRSNWTSLGTIATLTRNSSTYLFAEQTELSFTAPKTTSNDVEVRYFEITISIVIPPAYMIQQETYIICAYGLTPTLAKRKNMVGVNTTDFADGDGFIIKESTGHYMVRMSNGVEDVFYVNLLNGTIGGAGTFDITIDGGTWE